MKKALLLLFTITALCANAQDTDKIRNWSFGTSLLPVFNANPEMGVVLKRYFGGAEPKGAIRLYASYLSHTDEVNSVTAGHTNAKLNLGYEWIRHEGKFSFNYGADLALATGRTDNEDGIYKTETGQVGLKLFIGTSYRVNRHLSLSSELGKLLAGQKVNKYNNPGDAAIEHKVMIDDFFTGQLLMLNYHF